jgi:hypothetical protein
MVCIDFRIERERDFEKVSRQRGDEHLTRFKMKEKQL